MSIEQAVSIFILTCAGTIALIVVVAVVFVVARDDGDVHLRADTVHRLHDAHLDGLNVAGILRVVS